MADDDRISLTYPKDQDPKWADLVWDVFKKEYPVRSLFEVALKQAWKDGAVTLRVNETELRAEAKRRGMA